VKIMNDGSDTILDDPINDDLGQVMNTGVQIDVKEEGDPDQKSGLTPTQLINLT
jgi:hypothetical protein